MKPTQQPKLSRYQLLSLAVAARCDPRSVARAYARRNTRSMVLVRIVEAAAALGISPPPQDAR